MIAALAVALPLVAPSDLATTYTQAVRTDDATLAAHLRIEVRLMNVATPSSALTAPSEIVRASSR